MSRRNHQALIDLRRVRVASLLLRQLTQREIVEALARTLINPDTQKPYSLGTINSDIKYLQQEWRVQARQTLDAHQGRVWAELQEIKREAWAQRDLKVVLTCLAQERALLGLDAAVKVRGTLDLPPSDLSGVDLATLSEAELDKLIENLEESD